MDRLDPRNDNEVTLGSVNADRHGTGSSLPIHCDSARPSSRSSNRLFRWGAAAAVTIGIAAFTGCPTSVDFDDYESVNLISSRGFDSGLWYFQDGVTTGTTDPVTGETASIDYVQWESTGYSGPSGQSGPVYRLRILNLFPNGDFEDGTNVHNGQNWSDVDTDPAAPANSALPSLVGSPIAGTTSLSVAFESPDVYYAIDLSTTLLDGFPNGADYAYRFLVNSQVQNFGLEMHNNTGDTGDASDGDTNNEWEVSLNTTSTTYEVPQAGSFSGTAPAVTPSNTITADTAFTFFSLGGYLATSQLFAVNGTFDNIRIVRRDKSYFVRLPVPFSDVGRPDLNQNGSYTVTVWVKEDPLAGDNNRFTPSHIALGLDTNPGSPGGEVADPIALTNPGSWREVSVTFNGFSFPAISTSSGEIILEMIIEIGHSQGGPSYIQPGSVLLASPSLVWNPEQI